jgi:hypothetical protein
MRDIYGVQELFISLFRWVVPQFDRGTSDTQAELFCLNSIRPLGPYVSESNDQAYTGSYKLTPEAHFLNYHVKTVNFVRAGCALGPLQRGFGARIGCPKGFHRRWFTSESNRGIEYKDWSDLIKDLPSKKNEKTHKFEKLFHLITNPINLRKA